MTPEQQRDTQRPRAISIIVNAICADARSTISCSVADLRDGELRIDGVDRPANGLQERRRRRRRPDHKSHQRHVGSDQRLGSECPGHLQSTSACRAATPAPARPSNVSACCRRRRQSEAGTGPGGPPGVGGGALDITYWPIGSSPGNTRFANASSTTTTGSFRSRSSRVIDPASHAAECPWFRNNRRRQP